LEVRSCIGGVAGFLSAWRCLPERVDHFGLQLARSANRLTVGIVIQDSSAQPSSFLRAIFAPARL
jgi:hypothetical protein